MLAACSTASRTSRRPSAPRCASRWIGGIPPSSPPTCSPASRAWRSIYVPITCLCKLCVCIHIYIYIHIHTHVYTYTLLSLLLVLVIRVYIYIYIHIYIYIYTYTWRRRGPRISCWSACRTSTCAPTPGLHLTTN